MYERDEVIYKRRYIGLHTRAIPLLACFLGRILSFQQSAPLVWGATIWYIAATFLLRSESDFALTAAAAAPFGLYLLLTHASPVFGYVLIAVTFVLIAAYAVALYNSPPFDPRRVQRCWRKKLLKAIGFGATVIGGILAVLVLGRIVLSLLPTGMLRPSYERRVNTPVSVTSDVGIEPLEQCREELSRLNEWDDLTEGEKLTLMQLLCNVECAYYGIPHPVNVQFALLMPDTTGRYTEEDSMITLNRLYVNEMPATVVCSSLLHECVHAYQYCLIEAYRVLPEEYRELVALRDAAVFEYEFDHYIGGEDDFEGYYAQKVERDARAVSKSRTKYYCDKLGVNYAEIVIEP